MTKKAVSAAKTPLVLAGLLLAGPALAQPQAGGAQGKARFTKQEREIQTVQQTELTKPKAPEKTEKKTTGPTMTLDEFVGKRQDKIVGLNTAAIDKYQRLIRITPEDDPQKPDFHFRIAELYAEQERISNFRARALDEKIFQAKGADKSRLQAEQKKHEEEQRKMLLKAVESYVAASQFKKYDQMDVVLFKLAYLLQTIKKEEQAREFFLRLIKEYPESRFVPDAYLSFAEYYFEKGEMDAALKFYERVEKFPKSPIYGYAIYKKGWCYINLSQFKTALETFVEVIQLAEQGKAGQGKLANDALKREARKDIPKAFARTPNANPDKAWEFFQKTGGDMAPRMMEALGEIYWEQGMFTDSTKVYHKLMFLNPKSERLCEWQNKVVRNTLSAETKKRQVEEVNRLGITYDRIREMQNAKKGTVEECKNAFHDTSKELALIWHKEAQKTKNPDTYALVRYVYKDYLQRFGTEKGAEDMAFYYGEVLWVTENWREAAEQYTKVVESFPQGKYTKEAAYAAVLAWKNALALSDDGEGSLNKADDKDLKPKEIPSHWKKMIGAFDTYLKYVPDSPELPKIRYRKARVYYEHNHFDQAAKFFQDVVEKHPNDELAIYSANLLLDCFAASGKTKETVRWVEKFMEMPNLMKDPEFSKQMVTIKINALDMEAREFDAKGNHKECGRSFLAAAESQPESPKHAERLYNAANCFARARLIGQAVNARNALISAHPNDTLAQKALYQLAQGYHTLAAYDQAATYYEKFATKYPGEKESQQALGNAYAFRVGMEEFDKAKSDLQDYIKFYGARRPQDAADKFYQMGEVYQKQGKQDEYAKHLEAYLKQWASKGSIEKEIDAHFRLGEYYWKKSCPTEGVNGACIKIERVAATGRQKAFYDINRKIKDKKKKIKEKGRTQCGPPTSSKITVVARGPKFAGTAQSHFAKAQKLFGDGAALKRLPAGPERDARAVLATNAAAGALFYMGEKVYEDFLRIEFPTGLEFQPPSQFDSPRKVAAKKKKLQEDQKKMQAYLANKQGVAEKLAGTAKGKGTYLKVLDYKVAHWVIAAAARVGQIYANHVDQLYTAPIPKHLKEQNEWGMNERELYCDALVDEGEKIEKKAVEGYAYCLKAATQEAWFNEWSNMCEVELNQMQPSEYPLAAEVRPDAGYVPTLMSPATVIPDLQLQTPVPTSGAQASNSN